MTSNPNWTEIKQALQINLKDGTILQQLSQDSPDISMYIIKYISSMVEIQWHI